ncbi:MAG: 4-alpha-glucanotransferase, partial [Clostridia bacterium]|nr:4-alpha-glucanotransferase [Clostridia bacterium]
NDTTLGFISEMSEEEFKAFKKRLRAALSGEGVQFPFVTREETVIALNVCALATKARLAVIPVQDMLALGTEARMNIPSVPDGNWRFRLEKMPTRISSAIMRKAIDKFKR